MQEIVINEKQTSKAILSKFIEEPCSLLAGGELEARNGPPWYYLRLELYAIDDVFLSDEPHLGGHKNSSTRMQNRPLLLEISRDLICHCGRFIVCSVGSPMDLCQID